jgi:hypothetical protein
MKYGQYTVSCQHQVLAVLPIKYREAQRRFRRLLDDLNKMDAKILRLFPSLDVQRKIMPQVKKGRETDLRVLIVAFENGFVNHQVLKDDYEVGGDSRKRTLPRLLALGLLSRSEQISEKRVRKDLYHLSGKGLILCAAFSRIFKSEEYVSLIEKCVAEKSLANCMLFLYRQPVGKDSSQLVETLHHLSDLGLNLENLSEDLIAEQLLHTEQLTSTDVFEAFIFAAVRQLVDAISTASNEEVAELLKTIPGAVESIRSRPMYTKVILTFVEEADRLSRSSDFTTWLKVMRLSKGSIVSLVRIFRESIQGFGDLEGHDENYWQNKVRFETIPAIRRRLQEESLRRIKELETSAF